MYISIPRTRRAVVSVLCILFTASIPILAQEFGESGDVPYVPTPPEVVEAMLKLGNVHKGDVVYDLGCGDGRIVVMAVEKFGAARGTGYDINPERIKEANVNAHKAGVTDRVRFVEKNLFDADIHDATVVTLYLLPEVNLRLRPKLLHDLKVGARIVSHSFDMDDWKPDKTVELNYKRLYYWVVTAEAKAKYGAPESAFPKTSSIDGDWQFRMPTPNGETEAALALKTDGNRLTGTFTFPQNRRLEIQDGSVEGNALKFTVRRDRPNGGVMVYNMAGTVDGDQIRGTTETEMDGQPVKQEWSAKRK